MKNKTTKIIALTITLTLILTLAACSGGTPADDVRRQGSSPSNDTPRDSTPAENLSPQGNTDSSDTIHTKGAFPFAFSAEDIYGNTVTEASLGEKELFFIYYWATWCGVCIDKMPDKGHMIRDFGDKVGFLMLLGDFDNKSGAVDIYEACNVPSSGPVVTVCSETTFGEQHQVTQWIKTGFVPSIAVIDAAGNLIYQMAGTHEMIYYQLEMLVYAPWNILPDMFQDPNLDLSSLREIEPVIGTFTFEEFTVTQIGGVPVDFEVVLNENTWVNDNDYGRDIVFELPEHLVGRGVRAADYGVGDYTGSQLRHARDVYNYSRSIEWGDWFNTVGYPPEIFRHSLFSWTYDPHPSSPWQFVYIVFEGVDDYFLFQVMNHKFDFRKATGAYDDSIWLHDDPEIETDKSVYAPGEIMNVTLIAVTQEMIDNGAWFGIYHGSTPEAWGDYHSHTNIFAPGNSTFGIPAPSVAGEYDLFIFKDSGAGSSSIVASFPITVR